MIGLKRFATNNPVQFSLFIALLIWIFYIAAGVLAEIIAQNRAGHELMAAIGRLAASLFFLYVLWGFGWLDSSGITRLGTLSAQLITLGIFAYEIFTHLYLLFGEIAFEVSDPIVSVSVTLNNISTGFIEEIPFRGIVLYAFIRLWGDSKRGIIKSVLYSSVIFGGAHLIHIALGRPLPQAILVVISTFLAGIYYAAIVLRWKTIWTVVLFRGLLNTFIELRVLETQGFTLTISSLSLIILLQLPVVVYGIYLIFRIPPRPIVPNASQKFSLHLEQIKNALRIIGFEAQYGFAESHDKKRSLGLPASSHYIKI